MKSDLDKQTKKWFAKTNKIKKTKVWKMEIKTGKNFDSDIFTLDACVLHVCCWLLVINLDPEMAFFRKQNFAL
jgi:hypothetical protein